jgi:putative transposase
MKNKHKYAKRIRLKEFSYKGPYRYFLTICCHERNEYFTDADLVMKMLELLKATAVQEGFYVWAYCFMPDHLHLLIEGKGEDADMKGFVSLFKQKTGLRFSSNRGMKLWEENYHEHILRKEEETPQVARYIFENPVRKRIVEDYTSYPYLGSFQIDDIGTM